MIFLVIVVNQIIKYLKTIVRHDLKITAKLGDSGSASVGAASDKGSVFFATIGMHTLLFIISMSNHTGDCMLHLIICCHKSTIP